MNMYFRKPTLKNLSQGSFRVCEKIETHGCR